MRNRTRISASPGSKWMSEAPSLTAWARTEWTSLMTGASSADSRSSVTSASPCSSVSSTIASLTACSRFDSSLMSASMSSGAETAIWQLRPVIICMYIQMITGLNCQIAVSAPEDIEALIKELSNLEHAVSEAIVEETDEQGEAEVTELRESADDAPVIKLVHSVLAQAVNDGASDIHFEPGEAEMRVRFRIDGVLHEAARVPRRMIPGVVSRVKIMSDLDIAEKRMPQDGRVSVNVDDHPVDLRVTTLPTQRGEGATVRILDKTQAIRTLDELGMDGDGRERFEGSVQMPYGAVLVTGPTGSGKSTTLYAALQE